MEFRNQLAVASPPADRGRPWRLRFHKPHENPVADVMADLPNLVHTPVEFRNGDFALGSETSKSDSRAIRRMLQRSLQLYEFFRATEDQFNFDGGAICESTGLAENVLRRVFVPNAISDRLSVVEVKALPKGTDITSFSRVNIVTGPCLFGAHNARFIDEQGTEISVSHSIDSGQRIVGLQLVEEESLYELESIARLSTAIATSIEAIPPGIAIGVTLDVPLVQYHLWLLSAFEIGVVERHVLETWIEAVGDGNKRVSEGMRNHLADLLGTPYASRSIDVLPSDNLTVIEPLTRHALQTGVVPTVDELIELLCADDAIWQAVCEVARPETLSDIGDMSYAVEHLRNGLTINQSQLLIAIDNPSERKILTEAMALAKRLRDAEAFNAIGIYPIEGVLTNQTRPTNLYFDHPGNFFIDESGELLAARDVVEKLFPLSEPCRSGNAVQQQDAVDR